MFWYSYSTDSPLQKHACSFLRNEYFGKFGWLKEKRVYFKIVVSKNKTFLAIKLAYLSLKKIGDTFLENRM